MSEIAKAVCPTNPFAVLTGPNLAGEIIVGQPTASVVASTNEQVALAVQSAFNAPRFRVYVNDDVVGCEVAGVVKNVIALAVGVAFPLLDWSGEAAFMLILLYSLLPIAFKLAAIALMAGYPLTAARHAEIAARLSAMTTTERTS